MKALLPTTPREREAVGGVGDGTRRIASEAAARYYGAEILQADIEDNPRTIRGSFSAEDGRGGDRSESNKISLAFSVENRRGRWCSAGWIGRDWREYDEDRVAAGAWQAVGIHILCGLPDEDRRRRVRARSRCSSLIATW